MRFPISSGHWSSIPGNGRPSRFLRGWGAGQRGTGVISCEGWSVVDIGWVRPMQPLANFELTWRILDTVEGAFPLTLHGAISILRPLFIRSYRHSIC